MSELNILVVTGLEAISDRQGNRVNLLLTEKKYVDAGVDTVPVKRPIFDPAKSQFSPKTAVWYDKAMEILGQADKTNDVLFKDKPWLVEGEIKEVNLPGHYFKDANNKYVVDNQGNKRVAHGFKTAIFGFETLEGITEGFRRRIDETDIVETVPDPVGE